jgi:site-specific DNA-adenine methylase
MSKYGLPYQGSKSTIANGILENLPECSNFYDLFGGGGAISHAAALSGKWEQVHYNELKGHIAQVFKDAIEGKYNYDVFKPKWVTREEFLEKRDTDGYVSICWSFGNNCTSYLFGKKIEEYKKSLHNAVVFGEFDELSKEVLGRDSWDIENITERRRVLIKRIIEFRKNNTLPQSLYLYKFSSNKQLQQLQQLQQLERLSLPNDPLLPSIVTSSLDYREIEIQPNSIIYCDIPYENTTGYRNASFDKKAFLDWAANCPHPVYISEYNIDDDRFTCIYEVEKIALVGGSKEGKEKAIEKLYWNKRSL